MTMTNEQRKRMKKLIVFMNRASYAYYNSLPEIISNYEYDAMEKELVSVVVPVYNVENKSNSKNWF